MSKSKFYDLIKDVVDERGVETPYKNGLCLYFPNTDYTYPFQCDGYMEPELVIFSDPDIDITVIYRLGQSQIIGLCVRYIDTL